MQKEPNISIRIYDKDFEELSDVDIKIVRLAKMMDARVVTNDFNLNKVAELYGVPVLNINELANAIKPVALPGEEILVHVIKEGKEHGQGIAYLEDGTMIVVGRGEEVYRGRNSCDRHQCSPDGGRADDLCQAKRGTDRQGRAPLLGWRRQRAL